MEEQAVRGLEVVGVVVEGRPVVSDQPLARLVAEPGDGVRVFQVVDRVVV